VHRTAGTLRVFGALSEPGQFSVFKPGSPQPPVTQPVRQRKLDTIHSFEVCLLSKR
jgi:hypothetical protein